jgi:hypothetical protein
MTQASSFHITVDPTNPGQFFACCGLLELANRLWEGAEGWFSAQGTEFHIACGDHSRAELLDALAQATLTHVDPDDAYSSPIGVGLPFRPIEINWWECDQTGARDLKVWAGRMESYGIAHAMQHALRDPRFRSADVLQVGMVVMTPGDSGKKAKKKEPYYFDARRAPNAHALDVGFSVDDVGLRTIAHPAVELLCLIGLQVARPAFTAQKRIYDYWLWPMPLTANLLLPAATGAIQAPGALRFRFENWFRTGKKMHKTFRFAEPFVQPGVTP